MRVFSVCERSFKFFHIEFEQEKSSMHVDLPLSPLPGRLRVWLFKDVENVK